MENLISIGVFLGVKKIDTVFYAREFLKGFKSWVKAREYIKKSLVEHDGLPVDIDIKPVIN